MSFLTFFFPERQLEKLNKAMESFHPKVGFEVSEAEKHFVEQLKIKVVFDDEGNEKYIFSEKGKKSDADEDNEDDENFLKAPEKSEERFSIIKWFLSFVPFTAGWKARRELAQVIDALKEHLTAEKTRKAIDSQTAMELPIPERHSTISQSQVESVVPEAPPLKSSDLPPSVKEEKEVPLSPPVFKKPENIPASEKKGGIEGEPFDFDRQLNNLFRKGNEIIHRAYEAYAAGDYRKAMHDFFNLDRINENYSLPTQYKIPWRMEEDPCVARCREKLYGKAAATDLMLTWDDLIFLHKNEFGLRHLSYKSEVEYEKKFGSGGDAVSLANFAMVRKEEPPRLDEDFGEVVEEVRAHYGDLIGSDKAKKLAIQDPDLRDNLIRRMEYFIWEFIDKNLELRNVENTSSFLLIKEKEGVTVPYEFARYPLGKAGSGGFKKDQIAAVITRQGAEAWNPGVIYRKIIQEIKRLSKEASEEKNGRATDIEKDSKLNGSFIYN